MQTHLRQRRVGWTQQIAIAAEGTLLGRAGPLAGVRVVVIGTYTSRLVCELALTDCRAIEIVVPDCRVAVGRADVVLITDLPAGRVEVVVAEARAALAAGGRLVAQLCGHDLRGTRELRLGLAAGGFGQFTEMVTPTARFLSATI